MTPCAFLPWLDGLLVFGPPVIAGIWTEALSIGLLAAVAARLAPRALLATPAPPGRTASGAAVGTAIVAALVTASAGWPFLILRTRMRVEGLDFVCCGATCAPSPAQPGWPSGDDGWTVHMRWWNETVAAVADHMPVPLLILSHPGRHRAGRLS